MSPTTTMDKRKIILSLLGVVLIVGAIFGAKAIIDSKEQPKPNIQKTVKTVFVDTVKNSSIAIKIPANGNLVAKDRVELYAEVQGVFRYSSQDFKAVLGINEKTVFKVSCSMLFNTSGMSSLPSILRSS